MKLRPENITCFLCGRRLKYVEVNAVNAKGNRVLTVGVRVYPCRCKVKPRQ